MTPTREDVVAAVAEVFPGQEAHVLALLDNYGAAPYERERERVQLALLALSHRSLDTLRDRLADAKRDYRDILCWQETGPLSPEEGEKLTEAAKAILARWGKP